MKRKRPEVHESVTVGTGVYFLIDGGKLCYIGISDNMFARVATHAASKSFDLAIGMELDALDRRLLERIETALIRGLRPRDNVTNNKGFNELPIPEVVVRGERLQAHAAQADKVHRVATAARYVLRADVVAELLGTTKATLADWRLRGKGPPFKRFGRSVVYEREAIEQWLAAQMEITSTADGHEKRRLDTGQSPKPR